MNKTTTSTCPVRRARNRATLPLLIGTTACLLLSSAVGCGAANKMLGTNIPEPELSEEEAPTARTQRSRDEAMPAHLREQPAPERRAAPVVAPVPAPAVAADGPSVMLTNSTGVDICEVYAPTQPLITGWESNLLTAKLAAGATAAMAVTSTPLPSGSSMKAVGCDGSVVVRAYNEQAFWRSEGHAWTLSARDEGSLDSRNEDQKKAAAAGSVIGRDKVAITVVNYCSQTVTICEKTSRYSGRETARGGSSSSARKTTLRLYEGTEISSGKSCDNVLIKRLGPEHAGQEIVVCR